MAKKRNEEEVVESNVIVTFDKWRVTTDSMNYILQRTVHSKKNNSVYYRTEGFYSRIEDIFEDLLDKELREGTAKNIRQMMKLIKETRKELSTYCSQLGELRK